MKIDYCKYIILFFPFILAIGFGISYLVYANKIQDSCYQGFHTCVETEMKRLREEDPLLPDKNAKRQANEICRVKLRSNDLPGCDNDDAVNYSIAQEQINLAFNIGILGFFWILILWCCSMCCQNESYRSSPGNLDSCDCLCV